MPPLTADTRRAACRAADDATRAAFGVWPLLAPRAGDVAVAGAAPAAIAPPDRARLIAGAQVPADAVSLRRAVQQAHATLQPGGMLGVLVGGRWRDALRERRPAASPSAWTLRRALRACGFEDVQLYAVSPSWQRPATVAPCGVLAAGLARAVLAVGRKPGAASAALLPAVLAQVTGTPTPAAPPTFERLLCSTKDKVIVFANDARGTPLIVRLPTSPAAVRAERRAHRVLDIVSGWPRVEAGMPRPLYRGSIDGQPVLAETAVRGSPLAHHLRAANRGAYAAAAEAFLGSLNPHARLEPGVLTRHVEPLLRRAAPHLPREAQDALRRQLAADLRDTRLRMGVVHGDFGTRNILVRGARISGVVDWEHARLRAPLVLDVMNYLDSAQRRVHRGQTQADTIALIAGGDWPQAIERAWLDKELAHGACGPAQRRALAIVYWLHHVVPQLALAQRDGADRERFTRVLAWALGGRA
jgi:hypothetical protein